MRTKCYLIKILVMNSEPGEHMRKMSFQLVTQAAQKKKNPGTLNRSRTHVLLVSSPDTLPLSHGRLLGANASKLGSCDKHPAYCEG